MQRWTSLYTSRSRHALANVDLWNMTRAVGRIAEDILETLQIFGETSIDDMEYHYEAHPLWIGLLDAGLCSLCQKILSTHDFLDELSVCVTILAALRHKLIRVCSQFWVLDVLKIMDAIISYCRHLAAQAASRPRELYAAVLPLTVELWANCVSYRDIFTDGNSVETVIPGMARHFRLHLRSMLHSSEILLQYAHMLLSTWLR